MKSGNHPPNHPDHQKRLAELRQRNASPEDAYPRFRDLVLQAASVLTEAVKIGGPLASAESNAKRVLPTLNKSLQDLQRVAENLPETPSVIGKHTEEQWNIVVDAYIQEHQKFLYRYRGDGSNNKVNDSSLVREWFNNYVYRSRNVQSLWGTPEVWKYLGAILGKVDGEVYKMGWVKKYDASEKKRAYSKVRKLFRTFQMQ